MDVLRPIAASNIQKREKKSRIWSPEQEAWGFFGKGDVTDEDVFLIWCSIVPGDRIISDFFLRDHPPETCTVLGIWKESHHDKNVWIMKMITPACQLLNVSIDEHFLFKFALTSFRF